MGSTQARAVEVVVLARLFADPRGRAYVAEILPPSAVDLFDAATADPQWATATDLTERALIVARALRSNAALERRYQADVDAGHLGFGAGEDSDTDAAVQAVQRALEPQADAELPSDGLLGGDDAADSVGDAWVPEASPPPPPSPPPPAPAAPAPAPAPAPPSVERRLPSGLTTAVPRVDIAPPPPVGADDVELAEAAVSTWLNAELDQPDTALAPATTRTLAVFFGAQSTKAAAAEPATITFAAGQSTLDVSVQLVSDDFTVPPFPQQLRVTRAGASINRALFDITPLHGGSSTLSVLVTVSGNFLQRLEVTFDVGSTDAPAVTNFGRPVGAASVLEERRAALQFMPAVGGYQLIAQQVSPDPIPIRITPDELGARIAAVRDVLLDTVKKRQIALEMTISPDDGATFLQALAFAGFRLFQSIFAGPEASDDLKKVGVWLRESLAGDVTTLQVVSSGFPVPWPLMYLTDRFDPATLSWDDFIGMRHVVEQIPMAEIRAVPPATSIESTPDMSVRVLYNDSIDDTMPSKPVAAQRVYWEARGVALTEGTAVDDLVKTALATSATDKVLYLYCHAEAAADSDASTLIFTGSQSVTLGQLQVFAPLEDALPSHPLVFINACESGTLTPDFYDGFVPYFLAKGARGVIGTECKTPGLFASEWGKAFFDEFFAGKPLGQVVLDLRRRFLKDFNNPLGLLYGVHCDTDTVVTPALTATHAPAPA
ncbi:CHAT domain-containing protein [uncultured Microbacterium sp.]|uniref:CHAT domain-containing protein n=1 Tax=uncultured Microbacterium sp. TaxID=191216 RepID=UPI0035CA7FBB